MFRASVIISILVTVVILIASVLIFRNLDLLTDESAEIKQVNED